MGLLSQPFLDNVRERADILTLVGAHVQLRKAGRDFVGLCPFHAEKSPSFSVSPTKQFYHCFGCGAHGNAFGWLTDYEGYSFIDAVERLAHAAGLAMPAREAPTPQALQAQARRDVLLQLLASANTVFQRQLRASPPAIDYLKSRGLTGQTAKMFGLGYATHDLIAHFPGAKLDDLKEAGLVVEREQGEIADKFRRRVMFPILDDSGAVIGFGGRTLGDDKPKYLNSPESIVFQKGHELYGLSLAKQAIRRTRTALVLEGYMDVVALHQYGEERAVAALGTSITVEQLQRLFRLADHVIFAMDGDKPGRNAADRAAKLVLEVLTDGKSVAFVSLPPEHDPDSYIRAHGLPGWARYLADHAEPLSARLKAILIAGRDVEVPEIRAAIAREASELLASVRQAPDLQEALRTHVEAFIKMRVCRKQGVRARRTAPSADDLGAKAKGPTPDRSRAAFYDNVARLCQLAPEQVEQIPVILIDDFAALICSWFAVAPPAPGAREAAMERIAIPALQQIVRAALVATQQRAAELGAAQANAETAAILAAIHREAEHAARVQKTTALFATAA
ncbi:MULTISPECIES: DNA primase [Cupriavidus]